MEELGWDILNEHPLMISVDGTTYGSKLGEIRTNFEVKLTKSARNQHKIEHQCEVRKPCRTFSPHVCVDW